MASAPAKKLTAVKSAAKLPVAPVAKVTPQVELAVEDAAEDTSNTVPQLRLKDLVEQVAEATDTKKPAAREMVEAVLAAMAAALDKGEGLNLPPLGRVRIARNKTDDQGSILTLKLKRSGAAKPEKSDDKEGLAEDGEDS